MEIQPLPDKKRLNFAVSDFPLSLFGTENGETHPRSGLGGGGFRVGVQPGLHFPENLHKAGTVEIAGEYAGECADEFHGLVVDFEFHLFIGVDVCFSLCQYRKSPRWGKNSQTFSPEMDRLHKNKSFAKRYCISVYDIIEYFIYQAGERNKNVTNL